MYFSSRNTVQLADFLYDVPRISTMDEATDVASTWPPTPSLQVGRLEGEVTEAVHGLSLLHQLKCGEPGYSPPGFRES